MRKNIRKFLCVVLSIVPIMYLLTGCRNGDDLIQPSYIIAEEQLFADKYERNKDINDMMTYTIDYIKKDSSLFGGVDVINLYEPMHIQVDAWKTFVVGENTIGEIVAIIKEANAQYVKEKTDEIVAKRQAVIDKKYEEAKKKAEAKGEVYDKPKKQAQRDDIHFDDPYEYYVSFGGDWEAEWYDYEPTRLVDPSKCKAICLEVSKYGIPYVRIESLVVSGLYNTEITQESDWVINGVTAAAVYGYVNEETGEWPSFVDVDGRNKAAKANIIMSGNIAFGGEGFTWESLMRLCDALSLTEGSGRNGFIKSSDDRFVYYQIYLSTSPFKTNPESGLYQYIPVPTTELVAIFDPVTQVCLNWTVNSYGSYDKLINRYHDFSEQVSVNVQDYQVDTNNYEAMRETIQAWINSNAIKTTTSYCAIDSNNKIFGKIKGGLLDIDVSVVIDGITYHCLSFNEEKDKNGYVSGTYISQADLDKANSLETTDKIKAYKKQHSIELKFACCVFDEEDKLIGIFNEKYPYIINANEERLYIASYEDTDVGFKNIKLLTNENVSRLITMYSKTYKLSEAHVSNLTTIFQSKGILAMRDYVNELFREAEVNQSKPHINLGDFDNDMTINAIDKFVFNGAEISVNSLTEIDLASAKIIPSNKSFVIKNSFVSGAGLVYGDLNVFSEFEGIFTSSKDFKFYKDITVGMSKDEVVETLSSESFEIISNVSLNSKTTESIILKNKDNILVIQLDESENITSIYLFKNSMFE